jgi:hypothetical protein
VRMVSRDGCFERTPEIADRLNADYGRSPQLHGLIRSYVLSSLAKRHDYSFVALRWRSDWSTGIVEKILDDGGGRSYAEPSLPTPYGIPPRSMSGRPARMRSSDTFFARLPWACGQLCHAGGYARHASFRSLSPLYLNNDIRACVATTTAQYAPVEIQATAFGAARIEVSPAREKAVVRRLKRDSSRS